MPATSTKKFSILLNKEVTQEPTSYKGKVERGEEACNKNTGFDCKDQYADAEQVFNHDGSFNLTTWGPDPKKQCHHESWLANGTGEVNYGDGSKSSHITGTSSTMCKNGGQSTFNSNMDSASYGGKRENVGTDTKAAGTKHLASRGPGGGHSQHINGNSDKLSAIHTEATMSASGRSGHHIGKCTINAEGGIGFGVNQDSNMRCFMRMEPDGTYHLQVTPKGQAGGAATVKINPDGTILVTSETSMTIKTDQAVTIETPSTTMKTNLNLKGNFSHQGNYTQTGRHKDSLGTHRPG